MPTCSYCKKAVHRDFECHGRDEARGCSNYSMKPGEAEAVKAAVARNIAHFTSRFTLTHQDPGSSSDRQGE